MKKVIFTMALAAAATSINAQLVVDSLGRVGIGTDSVKSMLAVGTIGSEDVSLRCSAHGKNFGIHVTNNTNSSNYTYGIYSSAKNIYGKCFGGRYQAAGGNDMTSSQIVIGLAGFAGDAYSAAGVMGGRNTSSSTENKLITLTGKNCLPQIMPLTIQNDTLQGTHYAIVKDVTCGRDVREGNLGNVIFDEGSDYTFETKGTFKLTKGVKIKQGAQLKVIPSEINY